MALQSFTITIGALTDAGNNGKNYVNNQPVYIKRTNGTLARIYRDLAGTSEIAQDGLSNVTNSKGQFTFFVEAGDYNAEYQSQVTPITVVGADYFNSRIDETVNQIILDLSTSRGFRVQGTFAAGFTYELPNDVGLDASGNAWVYTDSDALPFTVPAATTPSFPTYTQVTFNQSSAVINSDGSTVQDTYDALKATLKSQGLSGNFGFFADGFTYNLVGDAGIDVDGKMYTYVGASSLPFGVPAGTNPVGSIDYKEIAFNSASSILLDSGKNLEENNMDQYDQYKVNASNIYDVFVVYGQSQSVGYALNTPGRYPPLDGCDYWNGTAIVPLVYNMRTSQNEGSSGHAWVAFANEYTRLTGRRVLIVPCGKGGTSITNMSQGTQLYADMLTYATNAKAAVVADGYTLGTVSVLFHQGETDQLNGTTRDAYQTLFDILTSDMRNDIPALHFFNFTVGYPQNRDETNIQAIQTAQRYVARNKARVFTAFDDCGKFTKANGLLGTDSVHYTQRGYNLMGTKGAQEVARVTAAFDETYDIRTTVTDSDMTLMGKLDMPDDQEWKYVAATAKIVSSNFVLQDMQSSGTGRLSNVVSVQTISGGLRFNLSCRATKVLNLSASINSVGEQQGFKVSVGNISTSGGLYYVDVVVRQDLEFIAKGDGSILKGPTGFVSSYFTNILSTSVSGNVVTITHPASDFFGSATGYGGSSNDKFNLVAFASPSSTSKTLGFDSGDTYKTALVNIPNCKIDPANIIFDGLEISISCIVAEFTD